MEEPQQIQGWIRVSVLGSGAFGVVTLWKNKSTESYVAVKKCRWSSSKDLSKRQRERWMSEVKMMRTIKSENVVKFMELPDDFEEALGKYNPTGLPLLSMEYCRKGNLRRFLAKPENSCGLQEDTLRTLLSDVLNGIVHLHRLNITHRDIKPENILLQQHEERRCQILFKIIDLGYAKEIDSSNVSFVGTLNYLAPEIFSMRSYDKSVDYWSFGVVMFESVCGVHPFLPHVAHPIRFRHLKKKSNKDIYMYVDQCNVIRYSKYIPEENYISSALKTHLENWLSCVLQLDPGKRLLMNGNCILKELSLILRIKIVTVFVANTLDVFNYEINADNSLLNLQEWIEEDTSIKVRNQIILWNNEMLRCEVENVSNGSVLYIFEGCSNSKQSIPKMPKMIKLMFNRYNLPYKFDEIKQIYDHSIHFIQKEKRILDYLIGFLDNLEAYLKNACELNKLRIAGVEVKLKVLQNDINCYERLSNNLREILVKFDLIDIYNNHLNLMERTKKCIKEFNSLTKSMRKFTWKRTIFDFVFKNVYRKTRECKLDDLLEKAFDLLDGTKQETHDAYSCIEMMKLVQSCLKIRNDIFKNSTLEELLRLACKLIGNLEKSKCNCSKLTTEIANISNDLDSNEAEKFKIILNFSKKTIDVNFEELLNESLKLQDLSDVEISKSLKNKYLLLELN